MARAFLNDPLPPPEKRPKLLSALKKLLTASVRAGYAPPPLLGSAFSKILVAAQGVPDLRVEPVREGVVPGHSRPAGEGKVEGWGRGYGNKCNDQMAPSFLHIYTETPPVDEPPPFPLSPLDEITIHGWMTNSGPRPQSYHPPGGLPCPH